MVELELEPPPLTSWNGVDPVHFCSPLLSLDYLCFVIRFPAPTLLHGI
jgi:hypothetical protein